MYKKKYLWAWNQRYWFKNLRRNAQRRLCTRSLPTGTYLLWQKGLKKLTKYDILLTRSKIRPWYARVLDHMDEMDEMAAYWMNIAHSGLHNTDKRKSGNNTKNAENPHKHWVFEVWKILVTTFWQQFQIIHK